MSSTTIKPLDLFTYKELTPLSTTTEPTYTDLNIIQKQLNANAMSVDAYGGSGEHGFLTLVVDEDLHRTMSGGFDFITPTNPQLPVFREWATAGKVARIEQHYKHEKVSGRTTST